MLAFRGLVSLKRLATFFVSILKGPFGVVWRYIVCPLFTIVYRICRRIKKIHRAVSVLVRRSFPGLFSGRNFAQVIILVLVFMVTAGNLYASGIDFSADITVPTSILASTSPDHSEQEIVVEEAIDFSAQVKEVSYLGNQALSLADYIPVEEVFETSEGTDGSLVDPASEIMISHIVNAIRVLPESSSGGSAVSTRTGIIEYVVQEGESIGLIAKKFGLKTNTILWANDLSSRSIIKPGQKLDVLPVDGITYKVKRGDTILALAKRYKTTTGKILDTNGLRPEDDILIGDEIVLPDAIPPPPPRPAPRPATAFTAPTPAANDAGGAMLWPTSARRITQYYGWRHRGVDIAGPMRTPIYAAEGGVVMFSGWNRGGYGNMVIIDHGNGLYTRYAHATRNLVKTGDRVKRGDMIQLMGSTGRSTGSHIHFEVMRGGTNNRINPLNYVK